MDKGQSNWLFNGIVFDPDSIDIKKYEGFVYVIIDKETGKKYIGRKYLSSIRKVKGKTRRQRKESDWKKYWSSSKIIQSLVEDFGKERFERHIIIFCKTRGDCNRMETKLLWEYNVLEDSSYYNDTCGNFRSATEHIIKDRLYNESIETLLKI